LARGDTRGETQKLPTAKGVKGRGGHGRGELVLLGGGSVDRSGESLESRVDLVWGRAPQAVGDPRTDVLEVGRAVSGWGAKKKKTQEKTKQVGKTRIRGQVQRGHSAVKGKVSSKVS